MIGASYRLVKIRCVLPFAYQNILSERWEKQLFFIQEWDYLWGMFRINNDYYDETSTDERPFTLSSIEPFVPCEYEDISESELQGLTPSNHFLDST